MERETKILIGCGAVIAACAAGLAYLEVRKSKKQTAEIMEMATKRIREIKEQSVEHRIAHEQRMVKLHEDDAAMQQRHKRVMKALELVREEQLKMDKTAMLILDDLAKGIITPATAAKLLRQNGKPSGAKAALNKGAAAATRRSKVALAA